MKTHVQIGALVAVAVLSCTSQYGGTSPLADSSEQATSELAASKDLFAELQGSWFGEVKGVYRACFTFSALDASKPWQVQTISYWVAEGTAPVEGSMRLMRFAPAQGGTALSLITVNEASSGGEDTVFASGVYGQGPGTKTKDLLFWQYSQRVIGTERDETGFGVQFALESKTLRVSSFGSQTFCTNGDETAECGSGGYRPFLAKRVISCPAP